MNRSINKPSSRTPDSQYKVSPSRIMNQSKTPHPNPIAIKNETTISQKIRNAKETNNKSLIQNGTTPKESSTSKILKKNYKAEIGINTLPEENKKTDTHLKNGKISPNPIKQNGFGRVEKRSNTSKEVTMSKMSPHKMSPLQSKKAPINIMSKNNASSTIDAGIDPMDPETMRKIEEEVEEIPIFMNPQVKAMKKAFLEDIYKSMRKDQSLEKVIDDVSSSTMNLVVKDTIKQQKKLEEKNLSINEILEAKRAKRPKILAELERLSPDENKISLKPGAFTPQPKILSNNFKGRKETREEFETRVREANELAKRMKKEQFKRKMREMERNEIQNTRLQQEKEDYERILKEKEKLLADERQRELQEKYEEFKKKRIEREEEMKRNIEAKPQKKEYFHQKSAKIYEKMQCEELNKKKQLLAIQRNQLRNSYACDELDKHEEKYEQLRLEQMEKNKKKVEEYRQKEEEYKNKLEKMRTSISEKIGHLEFLNKNRIKNEIAEKKKKREKELEYASTVHDTIKIKIDKEKQLEREMRIHKLNNPGLKKPRPTDSERSSGVHHQSYINISPNNSYTNDLQKIPRSNERKRSLGNASVATDNGTDRNHKYKITKPRIPNSYKANNRANDFSLERPDVLKKADKALQLENGNSKKQNLDYLQDLRRKREEEEKITGKSAPKWEFSWNKDIDNKDMNIKEKYDNVLRKANKLEFQAMQKEKVGKNKGQTSDQVSDLYMEAIRAKLALLSEL